MGVEKARITFLEPKASGAVTSAGGGITVNGLGEIVFGFNPKEYTIQKSAEWTRSATSSAESTSPPEFRGSGPRQLSLELFLDRTATRGDVSKEVETLFACLSPYPPTIQAKSPSPPFVRFSWGSTIEFTAFMQSVNATYTLFDQKGTPLRAVCAISLEEIPEVTPRQNPTSGALAGLRMRTLVAGETLHSIAHAEYGDPALWRLVAECNGVDDPLRLRPGDKLRIPPADDALQPV
ncbi:MAG: peptidase M23 [Egibacteraceae bacterium]